MVHHYYYYAQEKNNNQDIEVMNESIVENDDVEDFDGLVGV